MTAELREGQSVIWRKEQRGGYGFITRVPVTIRKIGERRVQVEVPLKAGGTVLRWVTPERLVP